ncbi:MAG TPA: glutamine--tRNA ligase/YqeY domain fusion protein [Gemmatimonadota bacterium]|nr:glutamine--tRNA ligase/YqeY domain fusion protein [Gemmatimonadota bacterium]
MTSQDFIRTMVARDIASGKYDGRVATRFPPEPNGFLHIGHAKSIVLNFGIAEEFGGTCNLRYDDTNPETEDPRYVEAIADDIRWLGYEWHERLHASDYFEQLYEWAEDLVRAGKAYVDSQSLDEIRENRGTVTTPGVDSPYRDRSPDENLELLRGMRAGDFPDGTHVLRGKIDMAHPNMLMRDPLLYRIRHEEHYRRGDAWCIYPMYDYAHCLEDAIEDITHSLCTLEFKNNNELYEWVLDAVGIERPRPEQTEFARLELDFTVLSKRKLIKLVQGEHVDGWDDPRLPTIAGLRRRGVPPDAIVRFCDEIGVADTESRIDFGKFEYVVRDHLNWIAPRRLCVLDPLKVVITDYPDDGLEWIEADEFPRDVKAKRGAEAEGTRRMPFTRELWIERSDFMEEPVRRFRRLAPGDEVRLRNAYVIRCDEVVKDPDTGDVVELRCSHDSDTLDAHPADGRKVSGTVHWVSAAHALPCEVRLYDRLFRVANPDDVDEAAGETFLDHLNPESLVVVDGAFVEPSVADDPPGTRYQFERTGYFASDPEDSSSERLVFNRIVTMRDTWAKISGR